MSLIRLMDIRRNVNCAVISRIFGKMIDFFVCIFIVLMFLVVSIIEHSQKMQRIEFEEKVQHMRHQLEEQYRAEAEDEGTPQRWRD